MTVRDVHRDSRGEDEPPRRRAARRRRHHGRPSLAVRLAVNVPVALAIVFVLAFPVGWLRLVGVDSINMAPTLVMNDHVMVRTLGPAPSPGDVVLYRSPFGDTLRVGRIVARGGEEVSLAESGLVVDGCPVAAVATRAAAGDAALDEDAYDPFAAGACSIHEGERPGGGPDVLEAADPLRPREPNACDAEPAAHPCPPRPCDEHCDPAACRADAAPLPTEPEIVGSRCYVTRKVGSFAALHFASRIVPDGHFFVLNDNRVDERDSRIYGAIPRDAVVGVASFVYYASDESGIRWDRISRRVS